jgi:hypothetical protein
MTEIALGAITGMPVYRSPLWYAFSYTYRDEKILFNGAQWAEVSELYLGVVSELPATFTSTLWQDNTYEIITSPIIDLPNIPPMIGQKIDDHNLAEPSHPFIMQKITADIGTHDVSATAHDDIRTKIDTDLAAHDDANIARPYIRQRITDDIDAHNAGPAGYSDAAGADRSGITRPASSGGEYKRAVSGGIASWQTI